MAVIVSPLRFTTVILGFRRFTSLGLVSLLAACAPGDVKDGLAPDEPEATAVAVAPAKSSIFVGEAVLVRATARTSSGQPAPAQVDWTADGGTLVSLTDSTAQFSATSSGSYKIRGRGKKSPNPQDSTIIVVTDPLSPIVSISVTPSSVSMASGAVQSFAASAARQDGSTLVPSVTWSATGGTINASGIYTAGGAAGAFRVIAVQQGGTLTDTSVVNITVTAPILQAIILTPASVSLNTGATQQFTVSGQWSNGATTAPAVTYSAGGGAITTGGLYTAGATAGTFRVIAVQQGGTLADTAAVTLSAPTSNANECASPKVGWIWCDDFEQDQSSRYFEYDNASGAFVRTAAVGEGGSTGMRVRYVAGAVSVGSLKVAFGRTPQASFRPVDAGTANYREVYWRVYLRNQPGWTGGGGYKLSRATIFSSPTTWAQAMIAHLWTDDSSDPRHLMLDPASGTDAAGDVVTTTYNDFANLRWLGLASGTTPLFDAAHVGTWYCVEAHARLNTAGVADGYMEYWINGVQEARTANFNWIGSYNAYGINAIFLENYWNTGSPVTQERYLDRFVVSTSRIGC